MLQYIQLPFIFCIKLKLYKLEKNLSLKLMSQLEMPNLISINVKLHE